MLRCKIEHIKFSIKKEVSMPNETKRQDKVTDTPTELPAEKKPADVKEPTEAEEGSLPEDAKERTKTEFEKLKKANQELKAKLEANQPPKQSVLDSLRPKQTMPQQAAVPNAGQYQNLGQQDVDKTYDSLIDKDGYVDEALLKETLRKANETAQRATQEAQQARIAAQQAVQDVSKYTETDQMKNVHKDFPTLDPDHKDFDPVFFDLVRDRVIGQMTRGKQDVYLAASEISKLYKSEVQRADIEAEELLKDSVTAKENINAGGSEMPDRGLSHEELRKRTFAGDRDAMYKRIVSSGN